ncbi:hypothetical protein NEDG_01461 [Nematocida displodere]|uniref:DDT domain-containing protein n=1 Tax=Nematocida displodere TaxID=1805483 RepID=A0A177ED87_9MICR|nr:hypothetical protein NEDG_01461 [Nematocida displodere]
MIESAALRQFVISYFLIHPTRPLCSLVNKITKSIHSKFFKGEIVFLKSKELTGCIVDTTEQGYIVEIYDDNQIVPQKEEVKGSMLLRKDSATKNEVLTFLLGVTRDTPLGRVILGSAVQDLGIFKGQRGSAMVDAIPFGVQHEDLAAIEVKPTWQSASVPDKKTEEAAMAERKRREAMRKSLLELSHTPWTSQSGLFVVNQRILSVFGFLNTFSVFLNVEKVSLESFKTALFAEDYKDRVLVPVYAKLIKAVSHERRKSGKDGLGELVQIAAESVFGNPKLEDLVKALGEPEPSENPAGFTRIQWFVGDPTSKNWGAYMKSFVYDVANLYEIEVHTKEFTPGPQTVSSDPLSRAADRLLFLSFLIEICMVGLRFRSYFDTEIETFKDNETKRQAIIQEIKRIRGEVASTGLTEQTHGPLDAAEKALAEIDAQNTPEVIRTQIGTYSDIVFLMISGDIFYLVNKHFFVLEKASWCALIALLETEAKKNLNLIEQMKRFMRLV